MGSGAVLGLAPAPEYTFIIFVSPVGNYFKVHIVFFTLNLTKLCGIYLKCKKSWT
jgi:hypothetical protein